MKMYSFNIQIGHYSRTFKIEARSKAKAWIELFRVIYPKYIGEIQRIAIVG